MSSQLVSVDPRVMSGAPVFAGTRVPVKTLFDYLETGETLEIFLDDFPAVRREQALALLDRAQQFLTSPDFLRESAA
ncbi:DUF433 domain-containing protein [Hymenobacter lutimineralis]|uniref:DUF433 domain-containing protein n=1 Tax=Hymenobacter lutimineralis TaxID=2606448 RepID=A0A5D6UT53_9BACT|nr:DUF433 domain-containing protein [Hymenobacter lutimineralis]TYZ06891.1 DUF433 domain-containing protein [Hymenobacter lutimineralis]